MINHSESFKTVSYLDDDTMCATSVAKAFKRLDLDDRYLLEPSVSCSCAVEWSCQSSGPQISSPMGCLLAVSPEEEFCEKYDDRSPSAGIGTCMPRPPRMLKREKENVSCRCDECENSYEGTNTVNE